jgi:hypothetical protein
VIQRLSNVLAVLAAVAGCGRIAFDPRSDGLQARHGSCAIAAGATTASCPITPPHDDVRHTALIFQATDDDAVPGGFDIRCVVAAADTIACDRQVATTSEATISWQTVERDAGFAVQQISFTCDQLETFIQPIAPVDPASAFVLGSWTQQGAFLNDDDFLTLELSASSVVVQTGSTDPCGISGVSAMQGAIQVIDVSGATVMRGTDGPMSAVATTLTVSNLPPVNLATTALIFTYRSASNQVPVCELMVRGELSSPTTLTFSRGMGDSNCTGPEIEAIAWQRIDFGTLASVQPFTIDLAPTITSMTTPISAVDPARSIVLSTAQGVNGQGTGEGNSLTSLLGGELTATMSLGPASDSVVVRRAAAIGSARLSGQVIQWNP